MTRKSKIKGIVAIAIFCIVVLGIIVNEFLPSAITDNEFFNMQVVDGIQFQSENVTVGRQTVCVYAFLTNDDSKENDEFVITVAQVQGILKNQYNIYCYALQEDIWLTKPDYKNISSFPRYSVKKGSTYFGSVYFGIVPADCKQVIINGATALLKHMAFNLNGENVDFNLYYCMIEEEYPSTVEMFCINTAGEKFQIQSVDGAEDSQVITVS